MGGGACMSLQRLFINIIGEAKIILCNTVQRGKEKRKRGRGEGGQSPYKG